MRRARLAQAAIAVALVAGGTSLMALDATFLSAWVAQSARLAAAPTPLPCACPDQVVQLFGLLPDPRPVFLGYLVAIPALGGCGYGIQRWGRVAFQDDPRNRGTLRVVGLTLVGAMAWMAALYLVGGLTGASLNPREVSPLGLAFLASLVGVPSLVVGAGATLLVHAGSRWVSVPFRAARG